MSDLTFYMNLLKETKTIKQAAIINHDGDMIIKTASLEVPDVEFEPFGCQFEFNTQFQKMEIRLNRKCYKIEETEDNFLYGRCDDKGLLAIKSDKFFIIAFIEGGEAEYKATRQSLEDICSRMRSFGL